MRRLLAALAVLHVLCTPVLSGQDLSSQQIEEAQDLLERVKTGERGPFQRLRWFCNDGTVHPPTPYPCGDRGGGHQHGQLSQTALRMAELGFHVGTLFVALPFEEFYDADRDHDRLREIALQGYLRRVADGWDFRRAQYYRGARQVEDEEASGQALLERLLSDPQWTRGNYLLAVQLVAEVPHAHEASRIDVIRQLAKVLGDSVPEFQRIRVKIHSYPGPDDIEAVEAFLASGSEAADRYETRLQELRRELLVFYRGDPAERIAPFLNNGVLTRGTWGDDLRALQRSLRSDPPLALTRRLADLTARLRQDVESSSRGSDNLSRMDLNLVLQELLLQNGSAAGEAVRGRQQALQLVRALLVGAYGRGLLSNRELAAQLEAVDRLVARPEVSADEYRNAIRYLERVGHWSQAWIGSVFGNVVDRYALVEPQTDSFSADLLRSSVLLPLANAVDRLIRDSDQELGVTHTAFGQNVGGSVHGLNPGVAHGVLEIVTEGGAETTEYRADRIYVLPETIAELPPVGGILSLDAGNMLSHLQLLARSLGIPNGVITRSTLDAILPYEGREIFYAVSPLGVVVLKAAESMTEEDRALLAEKEEGPSRTFRIDETAIDLQQTSVLSIDELDLSRASRIVGPKAAGVASLRRSYPENVSEALVVPFGIFRSHLDQNPEAGRPSLFEELVDFNAAIEEMESAGHSAVEIADFTSARLAYFRERIETIELQPEFLQSLKDRFAEWGPDGSFGVFVRSDTNVEDLAEFSGAGLNLTVPNVLRFDRVLTAIRRVWASPFTERAYGWRGHILENPQHTYVSVLIQRSVPVEKSGVMVTTDIATGKPGRLTIGVAEGVGGTVGGEAAEALLVSRNGGLSVLLSQFKAPDRRLLRMTGAGGVVRIPSSGSDRVLTNEEIESLKALADDIEDRFEPKTGATGNALPWDVEFGFLEGHLWLFQIRPLASDTPTAQLAGLAALDRALRERGDRPVDLSGSLSGFPTESR